LFAGTFLLLALLLPLVAAQEETTDYSDQLPAALDRTVDYLTEVQPLLKKSCYSCHGQEKQEGGLRLDVRKHALQGSDQGAVIIPGKAGSSSLLVLVAGLDEERGRMPPEGEGTPLPKEQVALLRSWVDQGATWPEGIDEVAASDHWAFQPLVRPALPPVKHDRWVRNPIDRFVLARLEKEHVRPSPVANRSTLIRRLSIDLLGLLPSPQQVEKFLADERPDAFEQLVEELLQSRHYGERWGRHWLDLARYADSDGYEKDRVRPHAWRYRNWVIEALNEDMPFDQFSISQIAGDMVSEAGIDSRVASGFHRNTLHNTEGGTDQEEDRVKKTVDRINTFGTIWMGLTIGCAQCHSHKYDPISQREYYSMYAFFNNINETDIGAPTSAELARYEQARQGFDAEHVRFTAPLAEYEKNGLASAQQAWEPGARATALEWQTLEPSSVKSAHGAELAVQPDHSILAGGTNQKSDTYTIEATLAGGSLRAIRLEVLPHDSLPMKGPGRAANGNFVLTTVTLSTSPLEGDGEPRATSLKRAFADFSQENWAVGQTINDKPEDGWAVSPQFGKRHVAVFELAEPVMIDGGLKLTVTLHQQYETGEAHNLGHFRLSATASPAELALEGLDSGIVAALGKASGDRDQAEAKLIADHFRTIDPEYKRLQAAVTDHAAKAPKPSETKAQAVVEGDRRQAHLHVRGDFLTRGVAVDAETIAILPPIRARASEADQRPDRLDLANWLFTSENPLTPRVTVNRIWYRYFGRGIVNSIDDFGSQGDRPSHPELLDWLAAEFQQSGWRLKHIHRLITTSAVYRQSSAFRKELTEDDPLNILLARQSRRRVEAEVIRDLALDASDLLSQKIGGPSVRPPQPNEYSSLTYAGSAKWSTSGGEDRYRRGLYTFFQRTSPYPMLITFDAPDSNVCVARRQTSNTPLQALTIWNGPVFVECAQALGRRIMAEETAGEDIQETIARRVQYAMLVCLSRQATPQEQEALVEYYQDQHKLLSARPEAAKQIVGSLPITDGTETAELAAWVVLGRVVLNLDEFISRE
jgi:hypothetical protein